MSNYTIELDDDSVDSITLTRLHELRDNLTAEFESASPKVFVLDDEEDKALIQQHIDALTLIIKYCSISDE